MLKPNVLRVMIPGLLLITVIACSSDDPAPAAQPTVTPQQPVTILDQAAVESRSDVAEIVDPPPPVTFADGVTVDPGSDEADVVDLIERAVSSLRIRDIEAFRADCHPDWQAKFSVDELAASIEDESNWAGYGQHVFRSGFTVEVLGFKQFRDTMTITYMWREGAVVIEPDLDLVVEREDGKWWMTARLGLCAGVGQDGTRGF